MRKEAVRKSDLFLSFIHPEPSSRDEGRNKSAGEDDAGENESPLLYLNSCWGNSHSQPHSQRRTTGAPARDQDTLNLEESTPI